MVGISFNVDVPMRWPAILASSATLWSACPGPNDATTVDADASDTRPDVDLNAESLRFTGARIVSAYPARKQDNGAWSRVCGPGDVDGLITNVAYLSSLRGGPDNDQDRSIRPGDVVAYTVVDGGLEGDAELSNPISVELHLDCIGPASQTECSASTSDAILEASAYVANTPSREMGHNVLLLIDQSGSMSGLVEDGTWKEQRIPAQLPAEFGAMASDPRAVRATTAVRLSVMMNANDQVGVVAFNEVVGHAVLCDEATGDFEADLATCLGAELDRWRAKLDVLASAAEGRSNLWYAVESAYTFLRQRNDTQRSNHIIVVTDGPDTCAGDNATSCASKCVTADHAALMARIAADADTPGAPKIHVHFIQFESAGYLGRDPRQVEAACVSGGHYQFIDSESIGPGVLEHALDFALESLGQTFQGHWALAASVPSYAAAPPGQVLGIAGALVMRERSNLVALDTAYVFGPATNNGGSDPEWDQRLTVRKTCNGNADCGANDPSGCAAGCSTETLTCTSVMRPDLASCDGGFCCGGECRVAGVCERCD